MVEITVNPGTYLGGQLKVNQKITAEVEALMHQHAAEFIPGYKSLDEVQRE